MDIPGARASASSPETHTYWTEPATGSIHCDSATSSSGILEHQEPAPQGTGTSGNDSMVVDSWLSNWSPPTSNAPQMQNGDSQHIGRSPTPSKAGAGLPGDSALGHVGRHPICQPHQPSSESGNIFASPNSPLRIDWASERMDPKAPAPPLDCGVKIPGQAQKWTILPRLGTQVQPRVWSPAQQRQSVSRCAEIKPPPGLAGRTVSVPTTSSDIASGAPVKVNRRILPPPTFADPTDHSFFWRYCANEREPGMLFKTAAETRGHFCHLQLLQIRPESETEVENIRTYAHEVLQDARLRESLWSPTPPDDEYLGDLAVVGAHHTSGEKEDIIQTPPRIIDPADLVDNGIEVPTAATFLDIWLKSLSLSEFPDEYKSGWQTWRFTSDVNMVKVRKRHKDCTHEQLAWIEVMCPKSGSIRALDFLTPTDLEDMFRETFSCEIPKSWEDLAASLANRR